MYTCAGGGFGLCCLGSGRCHCGCVPLGFLEPSLEGLDVHCVFLFLVGVGGWVDGISDGMGLCRCWVGSVGWGGGGRRKEEEEGAVLEEKKKGKEKLVSVLLVSACT